MFDKGLKVRYLHSTFKTRSLYLVKLSWRQFCPVEAVLLVVIRESIHRKQFHGVSSSYIISQSIIGPIRR